MSAYSKKDRIFATKQISVLKRNAEKGLPSHLAYVTVCDAETGELSAVSFCKRGNYNAHGPWTKHHIPYINYLTLSLLPIPGILNPKY